MWTVTALPQLNKAKQGIWIQQNKFLGLWPRIACSLSKQSNMSLAWLHTGHSARQTWLAIGWSIRKHGTNERLGRKTRPADSQGDEHVSAVIDASTKTLLAFNQTWGGFSISTPRPPSKGLLRQRWFTEGHSAWPRSPLTGLWWALFSFRSSRLAALLCGSASFVFFIPPLQKTLSTQKQLIS